MENKRLIMLFGILFSVVFCLMYYVLFSFTLGKANDDKRTLYMNQVGLYEKAQSVQDMQEKLEKEGRGLNLTWEVRDGILNHKTSGSPATLEGRIVRLSDKIAYINHDIDDAIRAHVMKEEDIPLRLREVLGFTTRERLNTLIHDIIINSQHQNVIRMSAEVEEAMQELRQFMFAHVYTNPVAKGEESRAMALLKQLFEYYMDHTDQLSETNLRMLEEGEPRDRVICDYIAGMTDQYAIAKYNEYFLPKQWQVY